MISLTFPFFHIRHINTICVLRITIVFYRKLFTKFTIMQWLRICIKTKNFRVGCVASDIKNNKSGKTKYRFATTRKKIVKVWKREERSVCDCECAIRLGCIMSKSKWMVGKLAFLTDLNTAATCKMGFYQNTRLFTHIQNTLNVVSQIRHTFCVAFGLSGHKILWSDDDDSTTSTQKKLFSAFFSEYL